MSHGGLPNGINKQDKSIYESIGNCIDNRQFNKALKECNLLLTKYPEHGELLSFKGYIVDQAVEDDENDDEDIRKEEALKIIKQGILKDISNDMCWRYQAAVHYRHREYVLAAKSYKKALQLKPGMVDTMYQLASCQAQIRDYPALLETRRQILGDPNKNSAKWYAFA